MQQDTRTPHRNRSTQDLDADPRLPALPAPLDAALCCNAVYYLKQLEAVASSVAGALAPGRGRFVVSFGADCYRERALAGMLARSLDERVELVTRCVRLRQQMRSCLLLDVHAPAQRQALLHC